MIEGFVCCYLRRSSCTDEKVKRIELDFFVLHMEFPGGNNPMGRFVGIKGLAVFDGVLRYIHVVCCWGFD